MNSFEAIKCKIHTTQTIQPILATWRLKSEKIVFTNGCFDILHPGHVEYLAKARSMGNRMIVGINSDASVKKLEKGNSRPIQSEEARALVLASLQMIDAVIIFNEETPLELLLVIHPDILVKGGDYDVHETNPSSKKYIVGSDVVKTKGGSIITIPFVEGYSTSNIEKKIKG
ncbi:MAG: D-glycero-beta-D-manno-heptose 1-phosphate adenylyltransferase [Flavobacteriales bacterium]|nr:D-glycero-beta-D-manno-heptose 1-phosphate adenylyltransferase [Flavobacteriales bacterium]